MDVLKGFPDAIRVSSRRPIYSYASSNMVRNRLNYVSWEDCKAVTSGLKAVYQAQPGETALLALDVFAEAWNDRKSLVVYRH